MSLHKLLKIKRRIMQLTTLLFLQFIAFGMLASVCHAVSPVVWEFNTTGNIEGCSFSLLS